MTESRATTLSAVTPERRRMPFLQDGMAIAWIITALIFLLHLYFNKGYGYFRDEFNYMACGDHLQWGYVDQPPLVPFLIRICRALLGDSLRSIRFIPALATSLLVVQTALFARELGGRRYALVLTAIAIALAPQYLSNGSLLGTNCLEPTFWLGTAWFAMLAVKRENPRYWIWAGVMLGLGIENKYSILLLGIGIIVGLLLTPQRRQLRSSWFWLGVVAAFLIFLPNLIWNVRNHWPFLELIRNIRAEHRDVILGPFAFFFSQLMETNFFTGIIWIAGLCALLFTERFRPYRFLGWSFVFCYVAMFLQHAKSYYLAPIYPMLIAVGCVALEASLDRAEVRNRNWEWARHTLAWTVLCSGLYNVPITVPVLSPDAFMYYAKHFLPFKLPVNEYSHARAALPQWYSDQFGFKEIADEVEVAWNRIPANERVDCAIFAQDYGQAGAVDFFGRAHGLPGALSGDRTYFLWGPRGYSGNCMIVLDDSRENLDKLFQNVEYVGMSTENRYALEGPVPVFICKGKKFESLERIWPKLKRWR
ncbi:MAG TPA: glycosyltransferase family 39 protein [Terriglobales bacterium]